ncbi:MAG: glycosyltransferase [Candidatus Peribacteraceae bacterium]|nr:glycosyltransferase [Candidatus Peribacteraceae bacterium]
MKIALVHELLTMKGGAERVLRIVTNMFPDAPIYTLLYDERKLGDWFPASRVIPARLPTPYNLLPTRYRYNHHLLLSAFPKAVEQWDFSGFDLVLSFSSAFVHGIITNNEPKHLCYVHSPARYLWDRTHDVLEQAGKGPLGCIKRWHLERQFHKLRIWDAESAARPDALLAASKEVQRRIELYWRRESRIVYPPIDDFWLKPETRNQQSERSYYIVVSSLVRYKRIDLAIEACEKTGKRLKIVGTGPDMNRLKKLAGPQTEFYGYRENDELRDLYAGARATLFPGEEDFGLVPLESFACGTPVIAHKAGGALETMIEGETGEFFTEATPDSLLQAMQKLEQKTYSKEKLHARTSEFSQEKFEKQLRDAIATLQK